MTTLPDEALARLRELKSYGELDEAVLVDLWKSIRPLFLRGRLQARERREYLSVKLDDPSFPAPIYASLVEVEGEEGFSLIWSRRNSD